MKNLCILAITLFFGLSLSAETFTSHYYGSEIDMSQKNNPCKGNTDGGVEVIVVTNVSSVKNAPSRTVIDRTYSLPDGEILKTYKEIIDLPKQKVLHKLFPQKYTENIDMSVKKCR